MENKKKSKVDLTKKRNLFMVIGLALSLSITLAAFEWKSYGTGELMVFDPLPNDWEVMPEIPQTVIPPPKPPVIQQPKLIEVEDDEPIDEEIIYVFQNDFLETDVLEEIGDIEEPDEEETDEVFLWVEEQASFPGGTEAWRKFLYKNFKYPRRAQRMGIEGNVHLSFIVDKNGNISDIQVARGIGGGCDEEAIRVLEKSPQWNPGKQRGRAVKSRMAILVAFKLK